MAQIGYRLLGAVPPPEVQRVLASRIAESSLYRIGNERRSDRSLERAEPPAAPAAESPSAKRASRKSERNRSESAGQGAVRLGCPMMIELRYHQRSMRACSSAVALTRAARNGASIS